MSADPIADWTDGQAGLWPTMTMHADTEPGEVTDVLAAQLADVGWTIKDRAPAAFRARYVNVLSWVQLDRGLSLIEVSAQAGTAGGAEVSVSVKKGGKHKVARQRGQAALNAAVAELERRGVAVQVRPWVHN